MSHFLSHWIEDVQNQMWSRKYLRMGLQCLLNGLSCSFQNNIDIFAYYSTAYLSIYAYAPVKLEFHICVRKVGFLHIEKYPSLKTFSNKKPTPPHELDDYSLILACFYKKSALHGVCMKLKPLEGYCFLSDFAGIYMKKLVIVFYIPLV